MSGLPIKLSFVLIPLAVLLILAVVLVFVLAGGDDGGGDSGEREEGGKRTVQVKTVSAQELKVGDCVTDATSAEGDVTTFQTVPCERRHDGEVYTLIELEGERYPGKDFVTGKGQRGCRARLRRQATNRAFRDRTLGFKFVYPTRASWDEGDREITCLATFALPRTGRLDQRRRPAA